MGESYTILSAYTSYRHLEQYCTYSSILENKQFIHLLECLNRRTCQILSEYSESDKGRKVGAVFKCRALI